ncbi:hypothetical protein FRC03_002584 [Tulasnella sp. 419]|nr:hypothetical protein FRC03_002584 [Tulasnella sp. 419]
MARDEVRCLIFGKLQSRRISCPSMASSKAAGRLLYQFDLATRWSAHESLTAVARFRQFQTSALTRGQVRDTLRADMKNAMKAKDTFKLTVLRGMIAEVTNADKEKGQELTDSAILALLNKSASKRGESAEFYRTNNRTDLADKEEAEQQILLSYLPRSLTESEVDAALKAIYEEMKGQPKINLGQLKNKFFENPDYASTSPAVVISRAKELLQQQQKS